MSFLHPDVSARFRTVLQYFLWFQLFYSVWQFIRTAKFFRLPYVLLSSLWHGLDSCYKVRKLVLMQDIPLDPVLPNTTSSEVMSCDDIDGFNCKLSFNIDPSEYMYVSDMIRARHMEMLCGEYFRATLQFGVDDDLLWPDGHLIRRLDFYQAMDHVSSGKGYAIEPDVACFFDYSSKQVLNQNFLRFVSIWPLILQAKHFDFWSVMLSIVIIFMDVFSFWANKAWKFVQYWLSRFVKWIISRFSNRDTRVFLHTFMSTISTRFDCSNFVTKEVSAKVMKIFPIVTNMRVNKRRIQNFHPVSSVWGPWKRHINELFLHDVRYEVHIQGNFLTGGDDSSVTVRGPGRAFVKEKGWTTQDMAYFYGVCQLCEAVSLAPVKTLDAHNGYCCSLQELVQGVKERKFVVCEFEKEEKLLIS
ncbi:hypothetical protein O6H91_10G003200 [Diphasiastrum complanatum]|uniref:Uncharacterized protein n=3 Tax=Diphasiastrum complanatum TaxID=34168 RepID=A0ACC2CE76_DIPCM|nr:hypothetical protein O6H91_10G003200 [Diphasiastrum complanatum]